MRSIIIGNYIFAVQKSSDKLWAKNGKILPWMCLVPMKGAKHNGLSLKIGSYMLGFMH